MVNRLDPRKVHTITFDFDGVFTNNKVWVDQNGAETVRCDRGDGLALNIFESYCKQNDLDIKTFILTKETNPVVHKRAHKLGIDCYGSEDNKAEFLDKWLRKEHPHADQDPWEGLIYLGNDFNDLECMKRAGCSVAPLDAHPKVKEIASVVLDRCGGEGFVRHFFELFLKIDEMETEELIKLA